MIYLDYMSTTPVDSRVVDAMKDVLENTYGNPSSNHCAGFVARQEIDKAAIAVAKLMQGDPKGVIWTSGATEAINLALKGVSGHYQRHGKHIITSAIEHEAVLATLRFLQNQGFEVTHLPVDSTGQFNPEDLAKALRPDTILVSLMHANNESGVIQPIQACGQLLKEHQALLHVDAAQSLGKIPVDVDTMGIDLLSASAHKLYGPKGVGCLWVRQNPKRRLMPQMQGGSQQYRLRAGTLATHQIVGFAKAAEIAHQQMDGEARHLQAMRDALRQDLATVPGLTQIGHPVERLPGHLAFYLEGVSSELMMKAMPELCVSQHSACRHEEAVPSHVHEAMGLTAQQSLSSLRLALGRMTQKEDLEQASAILVKTLCKLLI